jgi:hypothetical protein
MSSYSPIATEILKKKAECASQNYILETVFINPIDLASLITETEFQDFSYYKHGFPLENGEVGRFQGVRIIVSTTVKVHKLLFSVNMDGYRSVQGLDKNADEDVNPSRRYN